MKQIFHRLETPWQKLVWILWLALVALLPVTSFPVAAKLLHTTSVAPASSLILLLLVLIWLPVWILKKGRLPFQSKPLLIFVFFALLSISLAFFRDMPDYKDQSIVSAAIEGSATLGMGILFYLTAASIPNSSDKIKQTLAVINWSGLVLVVWSLLQIIVSFTLNDFTDWMRLIQRFFSTTVLFDRRATGFASEPSWLAHQLNLVYLPFWISATLGKFSVHSRKIWKFSFENILMILGIMVLFASFSRGGLAAFALVIAALFLVANIRFVKWLLKKWKIKHRATISVITAAIMLVLYLGVSVLGLFALSKLDSRMEGVFQISNLSENPVLKYAENLQFGERIVYWQTGWNIFNDHSIIGVGVGFSGFYFPDYLPDYGWKLTEVRDLFYRSAGLLNIKSIWPRILAETGILGFSFFITFLFVTGMTAKTLVSSNIIQKKIVGGMGFLMLIAFIIEGFSVDSFALPYVWFTVGLVGATWRWSESLRSEDIIG